MEQLQRLLQNYEIIEIIGRGGMGAVYSGRQLSLDRLVAIKILPPEAMDQIGGDDCVERFRNEARSMARLNHPGIVGVYDFGQTAENQFYLVMEHIDGTDVAQMILSQGRLPDQHALSISAHVCDALQYAHSHGVIHRDIKPANILLNREGQVKIADFGLAKGTEAGRGGTTKSNITMGTPDFIAPEALIEGMTVDHRSDIYSVGVMLYNMLTGEVPRGAFKMPSAKAGSDPRFDAIILKAIQSEREERYQTTQEMRRDLDVILTIPMAKAENSGRAPVPGPGTSAKVPMRPVATGPRRGGAVASRPIPTTGPKSMGVPKGGTAAHALVTGSTAVRADVPAVPSSEEADPSLGTPPPRSPALLYGGIAGIALAVLGVGWWIMSGGAHQAAPPGPVGESKAMQPLVAAGSSKPAQSKPPAPAPSNNDAIPAKFTEVAQVPHNRWFRLLPTRESIGNRKNLEWKDGWIGCRANSEMLGLTDLGGSHDVQNIALKSVVRPPDHGKEWWWSFREGPHGSYRLVVRADRLALDFDDKSTGKGQTVRLREGSFPRELAAAAQWSLEATIRGDRFSVSLNGNQIFSQDKLNLLEPGSCWLRTGDSGSLVVKDVFFKILDDTMEQPAVAGGGPPAGVQTFKEHRYQMVTEKLRWIEAKARAESMGGHLATITSREEQDWIAKTFVGLLPEGLGFWVGGTNAGNPSQWRWITGESFTFTGWAPGEPNNKREENGLMFARSESGAAGWIDLTDEGISTRDRRAGFLVEMDDQKLAPGESTILPAPAKWVDVTADAASSTAPFKSAAIEDEAVKIRFQGGDGAQLHVRVQPPRFYRAMRTRDRLSIEVYDGLANKTVRQLAIYEHLPALAEGAEHEMVFAARGQILAVWLDGKYAGSAKDDELKSGAVGYHPPGGMKLKSLQFGDLGSGAGGGTLVKSVAPASTPPTEFEKRLEEIAAQFQTAYDRDIGRAYAASVSEFDGKYLAALDRAVVSSTKEGRLAEALKLRDEKQRVADKRPLPPAATDAAQPEPLKQLRGTYRGTLNKMEAERDRKAQSYYDRYDQLLEAYQKELTQQQKYDEAVRVKALRVEWAAKHPKPNGGAPSA